MNALYVSPQTFAVSMVLDSLNQSSWLMMFCITSRKFHSIIFGVHHTTICTALLRWSAPTDWCIQWPSEYWHAKREARHTAKCSEL